MTDHEPHVDLPLFLSGELPPTERRDTHEHLRTCDSCRAELTDLVATVAELRDAGRFGPVEPEQVPPFSLVLDDLPIPAQHQQDSQERPEPVREHEVAGWRGRAVSVAMAVLVVFALGVGAGVLVKPSAAPPARVALGAVGALPSKASGTAEMVGAGQAQHMRVSVTGLATPTEGAHYEVWLVDTATGRSVDVGTFRPTGDETVTFPLPSSEVAGYNAIDVTLQRPSDDGRYSGRSLLRGNLA
jgi:anti-sigma-K factor RskA